MMRPEEELILLCARTTPGQAASERITQLARTPLDWDYVRLASSRHGVESLLFWTLNAICPQQIPGPIFAEMRDGFVSNAQRNLYLARELIGILNVLETHRIPAIPFKGPLLAQSAYGNISLRHIGDLDIIVHSRDARRARELFAAMGFRMAHPLNEAQEQIFIESNCEFTMENSHLVLDVHWEIAPKYFYVPFKLERVWERLEPITLAGTRVLTLRPEDLLIVLCIHGARHVWERLDWLCSVSELVRANPQMAWDSLLRQAREIGGERICLLGLLLAEQCLGARLPESVRTAILPDRELQPLALRIIDRLFRAAPHDDVFEDTYVDELHAVMFNAPQHRIAYYLHATLIPTVSDVRWLSLPRRLSFLYYLLRPVRLLARFGPRILGRWLRSP